MGLGRVKTPVHEVDGKRGPVRSQAAIAAISGLVPTMFMTRRVGGLPLGHYGRDEGDGNFNSAVHLGSPYRAQCHRSRNRSHMRRTPTTRTSYCKGTFIMAGCRTSPSNSSRNSNSGQLPSTTLTNGRSAQRHSAWAGNPCAGNGVIRALALTDLGSERRDGRFREVSRPNHASCRSAACYDGGWPRSGIK
ncbi:hypothetical protein ACVWZL_001409 [Bradyrhizobium sp. GM2.4]